MRTSIVLLLLAWLYAGQGDPARAAESVDAAAFGMACDGSVDDSAALQAAIGKALGVYGGAVSLPAGRCKLNQTVTITLRGNQALTIHGQGPYATELTFPGNNDGIVARYDSGASMARDTATGASLHLADLALVRSGGSMGHDALRIEGDSRNAAGVIQPETAITSIVVRGGSDGGGWARGIMLQDVANATLAHVRVVCPGQGPLASSGVGVALLTTAKRYATQHALDDFWEWNCARGLDIGENIQGVSVVGGSFTGGAEGIHWNSVGRQELLSVVNGQFSTLKTGIWAFNLQNVQVVNTTFYNQNAYAAAPGAWTALELLEVDNSQVTGNGISGANVGAEIGIRLVNDHALVASDRPSVISGNTFFNLAGPVLQTGNDAGNVLFTSNAADGIWASPPVSTGPGTTVSFSGNLWAGVLFAVGYPQSPEFTLSLVSGVPVGTHWPRDPSGIPSGGVWLDGQGILRVVP